MITRLAFSLTLFIALIGTPILSIAEFIDIPQDVTRTWLGPDLWGNRLQDWQIHDGRIECTKDQKRFEMRTAHFTTHRINDGDGRFDIQMQLGTLGAVSDNSKAGVLIGAGPTVDFRAASLVHHAMGPGAGYFVGVNGQGQLIIQDMNSGTNNIQTLISGESNAASTSTRKLRITCQSNGDELTIFLKDETNPNDHKQIVFKSKGTFSGNIALVSHPGDGGRFWFNSIEISGSKIDYDPSREIGPSSPPNTP